ncbi:MAG: hypothetical protein BWY60_00197 [Actinobacteria bacterium ADurb.Bin346]|nr:MAG: hypothetical protein BWY60_00197 [Actinobacteria bacterium ADurb.Bin346]
MDHKDLAGYSLDKVSPGTVEKNEFEDIFREMLRIENSRNLGSRVKYCLMKISIENYNTVTASLKAEEKNSFLLRFSNFLLKNLRKKDIYLMSEPGKFLVIFPDISIDAADNALKRVGLLADREFKNRLKISWEVLIGTNMPEEIKPFLSKADIISEMKSGRTTGKDDERIMLKKNALNIIFRNFLLSFLFFSVILFAGLSIIFYGTSKFAFFPWYESFNNFLNTAAPGVIDYFSNLNIKAAPFLFFMTLMLSFSMIFGLGMITGFIINLKMKNKGMIKYKIVSMQNKSRIA